MKLPRFIKIPEYSRFEYKPVYHDSRKEQLEAKIKQYQKEKDDNEREFKPNFKRKFHSSYTREITAKQKKSANLRLMVIITFFVIITIIVLGKADVLSYMFNVLMSN